MFFFPHLVAGDRTEARESLARGRGGSGPAAGAEAQCQGAIGKVGAAGGNIYTCMEIYMERCICSYYVCGNIYLL